jgi:hypothetical protein
LTVFIDWIIKRLKNRYEFYWIEELQIGGHCGLCGKWVSNEILPKQYAITICKECSKLKLTNVNKQKQGQEDPVILFYQVQG